MIDQAGLQVAPALSQFIENEALPGTGIDKAAFWSGFSALVHDLAPRNRELLAERDRLQLEVDALKRRAANERAELARVRAAGLERLMQRYANVKAQLEREQRGQVAALDKALELEKSLSS